jgi:hypothetical protein
MTAILISAVLATFVLGVGGVLIAEHDDERWQAIALVSAALFALLVLAL